MRRTSVELLTQPALRVVQCPAFTDAGAEAEAIECAKGVVHVKNLPRV
jgi:hypothetical protein